MSPGLVLGLIASLTWGVVDVTGALAGRRVGSTAVLAGAQLISLVTVALIVLADPSRLGDDAATGFLAGIPWGVGAALAYLSYFTALRIGPLSVVSPVILAYGGATVALAVLLRGETLLPLQTLGAALATCGVVLAGVVFHEGRLRGARLVGPGVLVAVLTIGLFSVVTVGLAGPIQAHGWLSVGFGSRFANAAAAMVLLLIVVLRTRARRRRELTRGAGMPDEVGGDARTGASSGFRLDRVALVLIVVTGVCDVAGFIAFAVGLEVAPTWLVGLASSFGPVIAVVFAVRQLGERLRPTQWTGLVLLAGGVALLALAG
jgi:drug/metabolite transporter (DMT)-like permease